MLTPQDIQEKGFDKAIFGGYEMTAVDAFLEELQYDYETILNENSALKLKISDLESTVKSFYDSESSMRIALATAKNTCEDMINETEEHCRQILDTKNEEYRRKFAELDEKVAAEEDRLARACADTDKYIAAVRRLAEKQEEYLSGLRQITDEARPANPPRAVYNPPIDDNAMPSIPDLEDMEETDTDTFEEINSFVSQVMSEEEAKPAEDIPEEPADMTRKFGLGKNKKFKK